MLLTPRGVHVLLILRDVQLLLPSMGADVLLPSEEHQSQPPQRVHMHLLVRDANTPMLS